MEKIIKSFVFLLLLFLVIFQNPVIATENEKRIKQAENFYFQALETKDISNRNRLFALSADYYQSFLDNPSLNSGAIHYNLGTLYSQMNQLGKAVFHFKSALKIMPEDSDLQHNLKQVLKVSPSFINILAGFPLLKMVTPEWLLAILYTLFWVVAWIYWQKKQTVSLYLLIFFFLFTSTLGGYLAITRLGVFQPLEAVVLEDGVSLYQGPGYSYPHASKDVLKEGMLLKVLQEKGSWIKAEVDSGQVFWTSTESIGLIR